MATPAIDTMSWSVRLPAKASGDQVFETHLELVRELIAQHFPASFGYETSGARLAGPLRGIQWSVTRGPFRAELGVQRFFRPHTNQHDPPDELLRVVACAGLDPVHSSNPGALGRQLIGWSMGSWTVGIGALWLYTQGIAAGWAELLLLLPGWVSYRTATAIVAHEPRNREIAGGLTPPAALPSPVLEDGLQRWRALLPTLTERQRWLEDQMARQRPFRRPGHQAVAPLPPTDG